MSSNVVTAPTWLTPQYLQKILQNFFQDTSIAIGNYKLTPVSSTGDNYVGQIFRVELNYTRKNENKTLSLISKSFAETNIFKEEQKGFDHVAVELKMMSETLSLLNEELLKKGETEKFFPFIYQTDVENKRIFMEDLNAEGYLVANRKLSLDLDHTLLVIKALAKMHAAGYLFFQKNSDYKKNFLDHYWKKSEAMFPTKMIDGSFEYLLRFLHLWGVSEEDKNILRSFKGKLASIMNENYQLRDKSFNVLIHGDCWTSNLMFRNKNGKVEAVKIIDYQLCSFNSIGLDLNFFLFTSTLDYVKTNHLEEVLKIYYDEFVRITGEIPGFSFDTVWKEFIERLGFGFVMALTCRCMMTSEEGFDFDSYIEGKESTTSIIMYQRKEFIEEVVKLLPIFKKYGVFKIN